MKEIRFTIGDSNIWHSIFAEIDFISEVQTETVVAAVIQEELEKIRRNREKQKKVKILDEKGNVIGQTSDICNIGNFSYETLDKN